MTTVGCQTNTWHIRGQKTHTSDRVMHWPQHNQHIHEKLSNNTSPFSASGSCALFFVRRPLARLCWPAKVVRGGRGSGGVHTTDHGSSRRLPNKQNHGASFSVPGGRRSLLLPQSHSPSPPPLLSPTCSSPCTYLLPRTPTSPPSPYLSYPLTCPSNPSSPSPFSLGYLLPGGAGVWQVWGSFR